MTNDGPAHRDSQYWTHWQLHSVSPDATKYAMALGTAAASNPELGHAELVRYGEPLEVVVVWIMLLADDLGCAIERSLRRLLDLIDGASVGLPGRIELLAGGHGHSHADEDAQ